MLSKSSIATLTTSAVAPPDGVRHKPVSSHRMMSDYDVKLVNESTNDMYVIFHGPSDSPYAGGSWKVHVELPDGYPYKSPSIGFCNRMFHPNVDEMCALLSPPSASLRAYHAPL